jgi:hypothetical protein
VRRSFSTRSMCGEDKAGIMWGGGDRCRSVETAMTHGGRFTGGDWWNGMCAQDRVTGGRGQNNFGPLTCGPSPFELFLNFEFAPNFEI